MADGALTRSEPRLSGHGRARLRRGRLRRYSARDLPRPGRECFVARRDCEISSPASLIWWSLTTPVGMGREMLIRSCRTQDLDKDDYIPEPYRKATAEEVHALHKKELQTRKHWDRVKQRKLQELGFEVGHTGEIIL